VEYDAVTGTAWEGLVTMGFVSGFVGFRIRMGDSKGQSWYGRQWLCAGYGDHATSDLLFEDGLPRRIGPPQQIVAKDLQRGSPIQLTTKQVNLPSIEMPRAIERTVQE
jgi:hypothetical protein